MKYSDLTSPELRDSVRASKERFDAAMHNLRVTSAGPLGASEARAWNEPDWSLLDDRRGSLPPFPVDTLPASLHDWLYRNARGSGTTVAHVAAPHIGIDRSLLGTARGIRAARSWSEPATLWCAVVGFSGTGKTPGIDRTRSVVGAIEYGRRHKVAELQREHEARAEAAKAAKKKWEKEVEKAINE